MKQYDNIVVMDSKQFREWKAKQDRNRATWESLMQFREEAILDCAVGELAKKKPLT